MGWEGLQGRYGFLGMLIRKGEQRIKEVGKDKENLGRYEKNLERVLLMINKRGEF